MIILGAAAIIFVSLGIVLLSSKDFEGIVQGFGLLALLFGVLLAVMALVEFYRERKREGSHARET